MALDLNKTKKYSSYSDCTELINNMAEYKGNESKLIDKLRERFGAEMIRKEPSDDELKFVEERSELENMLWSLDRYYHYYDLLKSYGLEEKLMERLQWDIYWHLENNKQEFFKSDFYKAFKKHEAVTRAISEIDQINNCKI